jgi:hypothetical protein
MMNNLSNRVDAGNICFGLNRKTDEQSLALFLQLFSQQELLETLIPRLDDKEITTLVDQLSLIMRKHLQEGEYHELFLHDPDHHH